MVHLLTTSMKEHEDKLMYKILNYISAIFDKTLQFQVVICDGENQILFSSDNEKEIIAIQQYFEPIWNCQYETEKESYLCEIRSTYIKEYNELLSYIPFTFEKKIFYDLQDGYKFDNDDIYICCRAEKNGITVFRKRDKKVLFLRPDNKIQNVHLSQLIKDPLNSERKIKGDILLHCSACVYQNQAYVFPAQKGAGKSTLLMGMLSCNSDYLANDSLFMYKREGKIFLRKNPHAIRLGRETVENNHLLREFFSVPSNCEMSKMIFSKIFLNGKIQFVPSAIKNIFAESNIYRSEIEINYIVFPYMNFKIVGEKIEKIDLDNAKHKLMESLKDNDHRICWLPFYKEEQLAVAEEKGITEILECLSIETYFLQYSGNAIEASKRLIERIKHDCL